jgi:hypothetical protein
MGLGHGGRAPTPQSPIPNPQSPIPNPHINISFFEYIKIKIINKTIINN